MCVCGPAAGSVCVFIRCFYLVSRFLFAPFPFFLVVFRFPYDPFQPFLSMLLSPPTQAEAMTEAARAHTELHTHAANWWRQLLATAHVRRHIHETTGGWLSWLVERLSAVRASSELGVLRALAAVPPPPRNP